MNEEIGIWRYVLRFQGAANRRSERREVEGFLLREGGGYGCVQPWPEFGHPPIEDQIQALAEGRRSLLVDAARRCAAVDRGWRRAGRSVFEGAEVPDSHATIVNPEQQADEAWRAGFRVFKVKCGTTPEDASALSGLVAEFPELLLRLDFNEVPGCAEFEEWWLALDDPVRQRVDFLEDPFPFDGEEWMRFTRRNGVRLAADRWAAMAMAGEASVRVIKPAWGEPETMPRKSWPGEVVFTSAMDHPVGQAWAAWAAATGKRTMPGRVGICGLQTHHLFEPDEFSERFGRWGPEFRSPGGTGLGFDDLLESLDWELVS